MSRWPIAAALAAASLFGASTPAAKILVGEVHPLLLAGLLYAGSGLGLALWMMLRGAAPLALRGRDIPWLLGAIVAGGIVGPVLMLAGLTRIGAAPASLLLNLEGVFTALFAWFAFRENFDRRIALGMALIVGGGVTLSLQPHGLSVVNLGALAIAGACAAWALDNNLTRRISGADPVAIAALKGGTAGAVNLLLSAVMGTDSPGPAKVAAAASIGFLGYGISLVLFIIALRELGAARTSAYFSIAPLTGVGLALGVLGEVPGVLFWLAALLMLAGVWLHVTERHDHEHVHDPIEHEHPHSHDEHHRHEHDFVWNSEEPHVHPHRHGHLRHTHPHYPDLHHRHH